MAALDLERAIGFNGGADSPLHALGDGGTGYAHASGACVVLSDLADPSRQHFLRGHSEDVSCLAVSSSGRYAASGQNGGEPDVLVWDLSTQTLVYRLQEHDHGVQLVCFSDDERFLLTVGVKKDGKMVAWDLVSGCIVASALAGKNNAAATCACWGGRKKDVKRRDTMQLQLATGGEGFLKYWTLDPAGGSLSSEEATTAVSRHVTALAFSHEREYLYAGSSSGDFVTILVRSLLMHSVTAAASNSVSALAPLPPVPRSLSVLGGDDTLERLLVAGGDGSCTVWQGDGRAYRRTESLEPKLPGAISALSLRVRHPAAGSTLRLLLGTRRGTIHEASLAPGASDAGESGARLLQESHCSAVRGVAYAPHSSTAFVSASDDGSVRLWDVASLSVVAKGECQTALALVPACVAFTGEAIFTGWADGKLRAHDAEDGALLWTLDGVHQSGVTTMAISHNAKFIVTGGESGEARGRLAAWRLLRAWQTSAPRPARCGSGRYEHGTCCGTSRSTRPPSPASRWAAATITSSPRRAIARSSAGTWCKVHAPPRSSSASAGSTVSRSTPTARG
uniref:Uncharacterized protein n=1 Tax=Emiliania huxleyi TaxID=2903 RepID=A0A7S3RNK3_EMIHU